MFDREYAEIEREVEAIQIPDGSRVTLPAQSRVLIMQSLGGAYTVMTERGGMFRIEERNADALGKEAATNGEEMDLSRPLEERVWDHLRKCYDPEIPVNIVDLGLVYDCEIQNEGTEFGATVHIKMTLTAPGCGMGPVLAQDVQGRIEGMADVARANVEIVLDPPWNQNMMTEAAKLQLGFM
jgi:probable FeS assembly SUF system protein SufT